MVHIPATSPQCTLGERPSEGSALGDHSHGAQLGLRALAPLLTHGGLGLPWGHSAQPSERGFAHANLYGLLVNTNV